MKRKRLRAMPVALGFALLLLMAACAPAAADVSESADVKAYSAGLETVLRYGFQPQQDRDAYFSIELDDLWANETLGVPAGQLQTANGYDVYFDKLYAAHGEPMDGAAERLGALMNHIEDGAVNAGDIGRVAGWDLGFGQSVYLAEFNGRCRLYYEVPAAEPSVAVGDTFLWNMTVDQMMEAEPGTEPEVYSVGDYTEYIYPSAQAGETLPYSRYVYQDDRLVAYGGTTNYTIPKYTEADYNDTFTKLTEQYGAPTTGNSRRFMATHYMLSGCEMQSGDLDSYAGWDLGNGTEVHLLDSPGEYELAYWYLNTDRIQAPAADPAAKTPDSLLWDMDVHGMMDLEGVGGNDAPTPVPLGEYTGYTFRHTSDTGEALPSTLYGFKQGKLAVYGQSTSSENLPDGQTIPELYSSERAGLSEEYGPPTFSDSSEFAALYHEFSGCGITPDDINSYDGWDLRDGKQLHTASFYNEENYAAFYFDTAQFTPLALGPEPAQNADTGNAAPNAYKQGIADYMDYGFVRTNSDWSYVFITMNREARALYMADNGYGNEGTAVQLSARVGFDTHREMLETRYGAPANHDKNRFLELFRKAAYDEDNPFYGDNVYDEYNLREGDIEQIDGWNPGNGRETFLILVNGESRLYQFTDLSAYFPDDAAADITDVENDLEADNKTPDDYLQVGVSLHSD